MISHDASGAELERAFKLYESGDYKNAIESYRKLAEGGSVDSQIFVGWMYQQGLGSTKDLDEARRWYEKAAERGSMKAFFYLGKLKLIGGQYDDALLLFQTAADNGYAPATYRLGRMHEQGKGVNVDKGKAYEYFAEAARSGHLFAG